MYDISALMYIIHCQMVNETMKLHGAYEFMYCINNDIVLLSTDEDYERQVSSDSTKEKSMHGLRWDSAAVRKVQMFFNENYLQ